MGTTALHPIHVLLVEDDPDAAVLMQSQLSGDPEDPVTIDWSPTMASALERLDETRVDAILLDLGMPETSGYLSFGVMDAAAGPVVPLFILTADESPRMRERALARGAAGYFVKGTFHPQELRRRLREAVQKNWLI